MKKAVRKKNINTSMFIFRLFSLSIQQYAPSLPSNMLLKLVCNKHKTAVSTKR